MSEVRLIDANALKQDLRQYFTDGVLDGVSAKLAFNQILHDIDNAPTVEERSYEQGVIDGRDTEFDNGFEQGYAKGYENCEHDNERLQGDLISRSALKEEMQKADIKANDYETLAKMYENCVDNAPTISPEKALMNKLNGGEEE